MLDTLNSKRNDLEEKGKNISSREIDMIEKYDRLSRELDVEFKRRFKDLEVK